MVTVALAPTLADALLTVIVGAACPLAVGAEVRLPAASPATISAAMPSPSAKRFMVLPFLSGGCERILRTLAGMVSGPRRLRNAWQHT